TLVRLYVAGTRRARLGHHIRPIKARSPQSPRAFPCRLYVGRARARAGHRVHRINRRGLKPRWRTRPPRPVVPGESREGGPKSRESRVACTSVEPPRAPATISAQSKAKAHRRREGALARWDEPLRSEPSV